MIGSSRAVRVFARNRPTDLRKGFDGLFLLVREELGQDPMKGDLFLFANERRTSAKVLLWDGTGLCIYSKRLARGRFSKLWGDAASGRAVSLTSTELQLFLEGADVAKRLPISPSEIRI